MPSREEQMLLVKESAGSLFKSIVIQRIGEALEMTAAKSGRATGAGKIPDDLVEFLKRVIKDYVAVSR